MKTATFPSLRLDSGLREVTEQRLEEGKTMLLLVGWITSLRAGDSLHLAIASAHQSTAYTFDKAMAAAGSVIGVPVVLL